MSWLRRGSRQDDDAATPAAEPDDTAPQEDAEQEAARRAEDEQERVLQARREAVAEANRQREAQGPLDESEVDDDVTRVDLGALRVPPREGMELRLELEEKTQRVIAVTVSLGGSSVQMQAFAAPRRDGVWEDIRGEIAAQVTRQGGTADEITGTFGREVLARIPARTPDGRTGHQVARFTGIDGPRWFLRAVFNGAAALDEAAAQDLESVVRGTVVVRGDEAMAPRDLLPLKLPAQPDQPADDPLGAGSPPLDPLRRGPEITEIR